MLLISLPSGPPLSSRSSKSTSPRPIFRGGGCGLRHNLGSHQRRVLLHLVGGIALPQGDTVSATPCQNNPPSNQAQRVVPSCRFYWGTLSWEAFLSLWELTRNKTDLCESWSHHPVGNILKTVTNKTNLSHIHTVTIVPDSHYLYCNALLSNPQ